MDISVTELKHQCLEIIRRVERSGTAVTITRRGTVVARITPCTSAVVNDRRPPWEQLRQLGGRLLAEADESIVTDEDFTALR